MTSRTRYRLCFVFLVSGLAGSFLYAFQFVGIYASSTIATVGIFTPSLLALAATLWLVAGFHSGKVPETRIGRVLVWYFGSAALFAGALTLSYVTTLPGDGLNRSAVFSVGNWAISGSVIGLLLANYDLRRTHALHTARANRQEAVEIAQRFSVLQRVLRHDIRNKLSIIIGHVELLEEQGASQADIEAIEDAADSLLVIAERAKRLRTIVEDETPHPVDLSEHVSDQVAALRTEYPAAQVTTSSSDAVIVRTYPDIEEAIGELLANAIEHNPRPEAECTVDVQLHRAAASSGTRAEVVIQDNGPGIPRREQMVTSAHVETQLQHSRGTSLWLTRWIVDESDGDFEIDTTGQTGSEIRIRLPIADDE